MPDKDDIEHALLGRWVHAFEEDTPEYRVFRPATTKLPVSRGRAAFDVALGLTARQTGAGPTDRSQSGAQFSLRLPGVDAGDTSLPQLRVRLDASDRLLVFKDLP
jgi:hypothetical protein